MRLEWTTRAEQQLLEIVDYIAADDIEAALRWVDQLRERARKAARMPRAGRKVPELNDDAYREVLHGAYRIVYRVERDAIVVLAVFEAHHRLPDVGS